MEEGEKHGGKEERGSRWVGGWTGGWVGTREREKGRGRIEREGPFQGVKSL